MDSQCVYWLLFVCSHCGSQSPEMDQFQIWSIFGLYYILGSISTPWYNLQSVLVCTLIAAKMLRQSRARVFYCYNSLPLLCIYNDSFTHISFLIKYSFEGRMSTLSWPHTPTLSSIIPLPLHFFIWEPPPVSLSGKKAGELNQVQLLLSKCTQKQEVSSWGRAAPGLSTKYYLLLEHWAASASSPVCVHVCSIYHCVRVLFVTCITRCITPGINQSSSLVIRPLQFPPCSAVKLLPVEDKHRHNLEIYPSHGT